jgi:hypothetical protein
MEHLPSASPQKNRQHDVYSFRIAWFIFTGLVGSLGFCAMPTWFLGSVFQSNGLSMQTILGYLFLLG